MPDVAPLADRGAEVLATAKGGLGQLDRFNVLLDVHMLLANRSGTRWLEFLPKESKSSFNDISG